MVKKLVLLVIGFIMLFSLTACNLSEEENMLSSETITQIKQDAVAVLQEPVDEISFYYYGTFNESVVIMILPDSGGRQAWSDIFEIYYPNTNYIRVWRNGNFNNLTESLEQCWLTTDDLTQIATIHKSEFDSIYYNSETWL